MRFGSSRSKVEDGAEWWTNPNTGRTPAILSILLKSVYHRNSPVPMKSAFSMSDFLDLCQAIS